MLESIVRVKRLMTINLFENDFLLLLVFVLSTSTTRSPALLHNKPSDLILKVHFCSWWIFVPITEPRQFSSPLPFPGASSCLNVFIPASITLMFSHLMFIHNAVAWLSSFSIFPGWLPGHVRYADVTIPTMWWITGFEKENLQNGYLVTFFPVWVNI